MPTTIKIHYRTHIHTEKGAFSRLFHISSTVITITIIRNRIAKAASSVSFIHMAFTYPLFCSLSPPRRLFGCFALLWVISPDEAKLDIFNVILF
jgi:hypothetical protein